MIHDGRVLGLPLVSYVGLKAEIEALTLTAADAGAFALATNPGALQLGFYTGTAWIWSLPGIWSSPYDLSQVNSIQFSLLPSGSLSEGQIGWNADEGMLQVGMPGGDVFLQVGGEIMRKVYNPSASTILNGKVVYISGSTGDRLEVSLARADVAATCHPRTLYMATEDIESHHFGYVTFWGDVRDVNTLGMPEGAVLYLSATSAGDWSLTPPAPPAYTCKIGGVMKAGEYNGIITMSQYLGGDLNDLADVGISSPANGHLFQYLAALGYWTNVDAAAAVWPFTGAINKEPGGFVDPDNVGVSYDYTTRKITLTHASGYLVYYVAGVRFSLTSPWVSTAHAATDGSWFLYDTGAGPVWGTSIWAFSYAQFAYVNYNMPSGVYFGMRETHGLMPWEVHRALHEMIGTYRRSGGSLTAGTYAIQPASPSDADNTPGFDAAIVADEDLPSTILQWVQGTYSLLYFSGASTAVFNTAATLPFRVGSTYPVLNLYNGATFTDTETSTGKYFNVYTILLPATSDTESQKYRVLILQAQHEYSSLGGAAAEDFRELYLGGFTNLLPEFVAYARITFRTSASYTSTGKARIEAVSYLTGPRASQVVTSTVAVYSHTTLSDRGEPDQHPASAISNTPAGGVSAVDVQAAINELDGDKDVTTVAVHAATLKLSPVDADETVLLDSAGSYGLKKLTWAAIKDNIYVNMAVDPFTEDDGLFVLGPGCRITSWGWISSRGRTAYLGEGNVNIVSGRWPGTLALKIENAVTNLLSNPVMGAIGQWVFNSSSGSGAITYIADITAVMCHIARSTWSGSTSWTQTFRCTLAAALAVNTRYTATLRIRASQTYNIYILVQESGGSWAAFYATSLFQVTTEWQIVRVSSSSNPSYSYAPTTFTVCSDSALADGWIEIDWIQFEAGWGSSLVHGDAGPGYVWSSTPHDSPSSRTATRCTLSLQNIKLSGGTLSFWFQMPYDAGAATYTNTPGLLTAWDNWNTNSFYIASGDGLATLDVTSFSGGSLTAIISPSLSGKKSGDWVHLVTTFESGSLCVYLDGVLFDEDTGYVPPSISDQTVYLGECTSRANFSIAEFASFSRVLSASEVLALYASGRPLTDMGSLRPYADCIGPSSASWQILSSAQTYSGATGYAEAGSNQESRFQWGSWVSGVLQFEAVIKISDASDIGFAILQWNDSGTWRNVAWSEVTITGGTSSDLVLSQCFQLSPLSREYRVAIATSDAAQTVTIYSARLILSPGGL